MALVKLAQLAEDLKLSAATLRVQINRRVLTGVKIGHDWWVDEDEGRRYATEHRGKRGAASPRHPRTGNQTDRRGHGPAAGTTTGTTGTTTTRRDVQ